jgi:hypothetical protein
MIFWKKKIKSRVVGPFTKVLSFRIINNDLEEDLINIGAFLLQKIFTETKIIWKELRKEINL